MSSSHDAPGASGPLNPEEQAGRSEPAQSAPLQPLPTPSQSLPPAAPALSNQWPYEPTIASSQPWQMPSGGLPPMPVSQPWPSASGPIQQAPQMPSEPSWPSPTGPMPPMPGSQPWPPPSGPLPPTTGPQAWTLPANGPITSPTGPVTSPTGMAGKNPTGTRWLIAFACIGLALAIVGAILFVLTPAASASVHADTLSTTSGLAALGAGAILLIVPFVLPPLQKRFGRRPASASSVPLALVGAPVTPGGEIGSQPIQSYPAPLSPSGPFSQMPAPGMPPSGPFPQAPAGPLPQAPGPAFPASPSGPFPWEGASSGAPPPEPPQMS